MHSKRQLAILYGSQTGNAQDVAERIGREAKRRHFFPKVLAMDVYDVSQLPEEDAVVFVASTTGQGDCPDNMKQFWRFLLRKSLAADTLRGVQYAVFGLGDSGYQKFNVVAKKLDRRLAAIGGCSILERGLGDDQQRGGYDRALDKWLPQLWVKLRAAFPLPAGITEPAPDDTSTALEPKYKVTRIPPTQQLSSPTNGAHDSLVEAAVNAAHLMRRLDAALTGCSSSGDLGCINTPPFGPYRPYMAQMLVNRRITSPSHFQDTRHIGLDLGESGLEYLPGDLLAIFPQQRQEAVRQFLERVGVEPHAMLRVEPAEATASNQGAAFEVGAAALVCGVMDISGASPRGFCFQVMQHFASAPHEVERLVYFSSAEGQDDLYTYNQKEGRSMVEVLDDFPSCCPPLNWLLQITPRLTARHFSISSSQSLHPREAHVTAAVVSWTTPFKRKRQGLCTSWLSGLHPETGSVFVPVWVESGALRLPYDASTPLILVGPGTGVAPFRAFLQERYALKAAGVAVGPSVLVFGCRSENADYYYREEWELYLSAGVLHPTCGLITAFSRDQPNKVYVQQRIVEHSSDLWLLLRDGAVVCVAGSAGKMTKAVSAAFQEVAMREGQLSNEDAGKYIRQLELSRRYFVEAWS